MALPEFTVAIWVMPHRAHGYIAEVDASLVEDGLAGGAFQSFKDVAKKGNPPQIDYESPHREFVVTEDQVRALIELADRVTYAFTEHAFTPMLGGSFFGVRVSRGYQGVTVVWRGRYEDQDEPLRDLYALVQQLAEA